MSRRASQKIVPEPLATRFVPSFMLRGFWDELDKRGISPNELERLSGVSRPRRGDFLSAVPEEDMHRLFEAGLALTADPTLGLSVGRAIGASSFHLIGHIVLASGTLRQAIELASRAEPHLAIRSPVLQELAGGQVRFGFVGTDRKPSPGARVEAEMTAVLLHDVSLHFLDGSFGGLAVQFAFAAPRDASAYRRTFSGDVQFDADGTFVLFPRKALLRRRSGADAALLQQLFTLAQEQYGAGNRADGWAARVRRALRAHTAPRLLDAGLLADQLGVSARGLSRRLAREGARFSSLVDEALYERAQLLLRRPGATATQVASALGYAELSSFFRAFRRWSGGVTPNVYRQRALREAPRLANAARPRKS